MTPIPRVLKNAPGYLREVASEMPSHREALRAIADEYEHLQQRHREAMQELNDVLTDLERLEEATTSVTEVKE